MLCFYELWLASSWFGPKLCSSRWSLTTYSSKQFIPMLAFTFQKKLVQAFD
uniref:Uncharacterized protein n=1 Tax=Arundo donax TaxID=35708 RepID=A0A0A9GU49_ARUDO